MKELTDLRKNHEQTLFRARPMEERDREERQWRQRHPQQPVGEPLPRPTAAASNEAPGGSIGGDNNEPAEQTESLATDLDSMSWGEIGELHQDEALKLIEENLQAVLPTSGQLGSQEAQK